MTPKTRILIFDDDRDSVTIYSKVLDRKGYEVVTRAHCLDCLEVVGFFHPDVIFMDHNMPGKCGLEAVASLKSHAEFRSIPIVYFSSSAELERLARKAGADAYLQKPCTMTTFEKAIQTAISISH
ncbi:MAG: response regulator [Sphingobacteriales bacterium]|nr:MAG: response regulator [Sphingobacteriales bacterium]